MTLNNIIGRIGEKYFVYPPAKSNDLNFAFSRGIPEELCSLYELCDGAFIGKGNDFTSPDGLGYRLKIPRLAELQTTQSFGYISQDSPLYNQSKKWWQIVDYCDANWLAYDACLGSNGRILDLFHETVGEQESHDIVAYSLVDLLTRLCDHDGIYWFDEDFKSLGQV